MADERNHQPAQHQPAQHRSAQAEHQPAPVQHQPAPVPPALNPALIGDLQKGRMPGDLNKIGR
jgi:hypothetical protein